MYRYIDRMSNAINSDLNVSTIIDLARQTLFRVPDRDATDAKKAESILKKKKMEVEDVNFLLTFTYVHRHEATQPRTIRSMLNEIFEVIGSSSRKDSYAPTVSKSDLEQIHTYIMSLKK